ncbi:LLM class F420-dependent oxidoreductase [Candidatus Poriferisodalis sp.]|uniref:LLM class F420-dependent oxidoreductase n=1 Tax=Candidatus Poriferisodalis sp. TaxID=3101277 RepID=UPI003B014B15
MSTTGSTKTKGARAQPYGVTVGSLGVLGPAAVTDIARSAEAQGYSSIWTVEATGTDAFSLLGAVAHAAPGIDLATGIIPIQLRAPTLVAMTASTLQSLKADRDVLVGLGVSAPGILRQHGEQPPDRPIAMMREYVALLRECLSGESVTFEGDFWQVRRFRLAMRLGERRPKIVLAALNPQMLRLAGEVADGVLLNYLPASHVPSVVAEVRKGGEAQIICYVHAAAGDLERSARSAQRDLLNYALADGYANAFRAAGFGDEVDEARARQSERDREGAIAAISNEMIQAIDFIGTPAEIVEFTQAYVDAGVEYPVLMPLPWGEDRRAVTGETMAAFASSFS